MFILINMKVIIVVITVSVIILISLSTTIQVHRLSIETHQFARVSLLTIAPINVTVSIVI